MCGDFATLIGVFFGNFSKTLPGRYKFLLDVSILNCDVVCHCVLVKGKKCTPRVIGMIYFPDTENNALHRVFIHLETSLNPISAEISGSRASATAIPPTHTH